MRLIDADKLHFKKVWIRHEYDENADVVVFAREIDKAEKIEAIPIEWIKNWCNEHGRKSLEERLLKRYGVITLLEDWEKENE